MYYLITYAIKEEFVTEQEVDNVELIKRLRVLNDTGIRYQMFRAVNDPDEYHQRFNYAEEGVPFFQIQSFEDVAARDRLRGYTFFREYRARLIERCVHPPRNISLKTLDVWPDKTEHTATCER